MQRRKGAEATHARVYVAIGLTGFLFFLHPLTVQGVDARRADDEEKNSRTLQVEEAKITAQIDPELGALYAKVLLKLKNRTGRDLSVLDIILPSFPGAEFKVNIVWDRHEELPWRRLVRQESEGEFRIQFPLTHSLRAGKSAIVGISWEIQVSQAQNKDKDTAPVVITADRVQLRGHGWYPVTQNGGAAKRLRLTLKFPKTWKATVPRKAKKRRTGFLLTEYELSPSGDFAGAVVFAAHAPLGPDTAVPK